MKGKKNKVLMIVIILSVIVIGLVVALLVLLKGENDKKNNTEIETKTDTIVEEQTTEIKETKLSKEYVSIPIGNEYMEVYKELDGGYYLLKYDYDLDECTIYTKKDENAVAEEAVILPGVKEVFTNGEALLYLKNNEKEVTLNCSQMDGKEEKIISNLDYNGNNISGTILGTYEEKCYLASNEADETKDEIYCVWMETGKCTKVPVEDKEFWTGGVEDGFLYRNYLIGTVYHTSPGSRKEMVLNLLTGEVRTLSEKCAAIYTKGNIIYYVEGESMSDLYYSEKTNTVKVIQCKFDGTEEKVLKTFEAPVCSGYYFENGTLKWTRVLEDYSEKTKTIEYLQGDVSKNLDKEGFYTGAGISLEKIGNSGGKMLEITDLTENTVSFDYTVVQESGALRVAEITVKDVEIKNGVANFTFDDDGWFNRGKGVLKLADDKTVIIQITITHEGEDKTWSIGSGRVVLEKVN